MYDTKDIQKKYYNQKIKEIKLVFINYFGNEDYFNHLVASSSLDKHIKIFNKANKNLSNDLFKDFIDELIEFDMINHYVYSNILNYDCSDCFFGYSPLLNFIMKADNFNTSNETSRNYKTYFSDYLSYEEFDISSKRFDSFKYLTKRINWSKIIKYSFRKGKFGNDVSSKIIEESLPDMFQMRSASVNYAPLDIESFLLIVVHGMFDNIKIIERIAISERSLYISPEIFGFIREYALFDDEDVSVRYNMLHMKNIKELKVKKLNEIYAHNLEKFYQFLKIKVSTESLLLIALK